MALPPQYDLVTLTGRYVDILGNPLAGQQIRLTLAPEALVVTAADTIITPDVRIITLDVNGYFSVDVPASDDPDVNPNGWTYHVEEGFGARRSYNIEVLRPGPHDMSDLAPVASSPGVGIVVGPGVKAGGTTGQVLAKVSNADYDTAWVPQASGGGGAVASVNGKTGAVVLGPDDVKAAWSGATAILGTSITDANKPYDQGGGVMADTGAGYFHWANMFLRQSLKLVLEAGVSGDTTGAMLTRVGDVISSGARICVVEPGPNDVQGDSTFANITTALTGIYNALRAAGILVAMGQICPSVPIMGTPSRVVTMHQVNRWISEFARTNPGIVVVPWAGRMTDPATGSPLTGTLYDDRHPGTLGAALMGSALADALEPYVSTAEDLVYSNADPTNLIANGMALGSASGVATGWTVNGGSATYTASKVARQDGDPGEWQQIAVTSGNVEVYTPVGTTGFAAGDSITADFEIDGDLTNATRVEVQVWAVDGTGFPVAGGAAITLSDYYSTTKRIPISRGFARSRPLTIPAGATGVRAVFIVAGSATVRVSRASVRKVTI